jgi:adenylate cyclase
MYRETTDLLTKAQSERRSTARRIEQFVSEIERQISWARAPAPPVEQRRADYSLLLQRSAGYRPADPARRVRRGRLGLTRRGSSWQRDRLLRQPAIHADARAIGLAFAGLFRLDSDPFMTIAMAHSGRNAGSTVAEVNLKFLSSFIDTDQIGKDNAAYIVGPVGRLLADSIPNAAWARTSATFPRSRP